jgi:hypothetical protein
MSKRQSLGKTTKPERKTCKSRIWSVILKPTMNTIEAGGKYVVNVVTPLPHCVKQIELDSARK